MRVKYEFQTGEVIEVEVSHNIGEIYLTVDKEICNGHRRETRRHESYSNDNDKREVLVDLSVDVEAEVLKNLEYEVLYIAIKRLQPQQQELLHKVFFEERKMADIAREEGVSSKAIQGRLNKIKDRLGKIIGNNLL